VRVLVLHSDDFTWLGTKLALLVISEMAVVIAVGCSPVLPRLYLYLRGPAPSDNAVDRIRGTQANRTIGGSGGPEHTITRKKTPKGATLTSSLAKYMGPEGSFGLTTLGSRIGKEEDQVELTPYASSHSTSGIWKTVEIDQESATHRVP
jgi:hypothetical protein